MKIIFLTSSLGTGGAERVATTLANAWVTSRDDKVTLIPTFSGMGKPFYPLSKKVELIFLADRVGGVSGGNNKRYVSRFVALRNLIQEKKPDVVVSFLPNVNIAAILATSGTKIPVVVGVRSDPTQQPIGRLWSIACRVLYRFADGVTVQTQSVAASIHSLYGGLGNIFVLPNPIPDELARWHAVNARTDGRRVLLSMGRLAHEKRVDRIIAAFAAVQGDFPEWDLHIYGEGPLSSQLQGQVAQTGLSGRIFFKVRTSNPWAAMAQADAFVMASAYEGFPNALLEAMAVGLPCVATDCLSGPREITRNGHDALLVSTEDPRELQAALQRLLTDGALRASLGARARESVWERYSLATVLKHWDSVFASVGAIR
jgi:GalNAc-alpha-(1->4)-GalNAc-alpha-(1->3)-diNAcBac-PP-undecaprenol alpha-1,4-N-acetyl-D-galactosaminyltransferase